MRRAITAALVLLGTACEGQLPFGPEAYQTGAQTAAPADAGAPATPAPKVGAGAGAGADANAAWPPRADAGWPMEGGSAPWPPTDAAAGPPPDAASAAAGCPGGGSALTLLAMRCGACHGPEMPAKQLDLVSPGLGARVVGKTSSCNGRPFLDTASAPPSGLLLDKLNGPVSGCGSQMPYGSPPLTEAERACIAGWAATAITNAGPGR